MGICVVVFDFVVYVEFCIIDEFDIVFFGVEGDNVFVWVICGDVGVF